MQGPALKKAFAGRAAHFNIEVKDAGWWWFDGGGG